MTVSITSWHLDHAGTDLPILSGGFTVDEINVPAVSGTVVVPDTPGLLMQLDPRTSPPPRVQITGQRTYWASMTVAEFSAALTAAGLLTVAQVSTAWTGWTVADVSDAYGTPLSDQGADPTDTMSMSLHVRSVRRDVRGGTLAVSVASDEALLTDWAPSRTSDLSALNELVAGQPVRVSTYVNAVLETVIGRRLTPGVYDTDVPSEVFPWTIDMTAWEMIRPFLDDTNTKLRVHPDGETWTLERPENQITADGFHHFPAAELLDGFEEYSRTGDWYDAVILAAVNPVTGLDRTAGYPAGPHSRTYRERLPRDSRPNQSMARNIHTRSIQRGRLAEVRIPINVGVWMRDVFTYRTAAEPSPLPSWQVASVAYDITTDLMDITGIQPY